MAWSAEDAQKPERGRFLREYGHTTCSLHAGPRREAETERKFSVQAYMSCRAEADATLDGGEAEDKEDNKATTCCSDCGVPFAPGVSCHAFHM